MRVTIGEREEGLFCGRICEKGLQVTERDLVSGLACCFVALCGVEQLKGRDLMLFRHANSVVTGADPCGGFHLRGI